MSNSSNVNGMPRSSHFSPPSTSLSPTWGPPRSPLPPHRLAKLANALGVSTPMPAVHPTTPFISRSFLDSSGSLDNFRRSPTPSASSHNFSPCSPSTSKYLLHVIPPLHLPHESDSFDDSDMTPPPLNASGYHTQFRRGTLVPVHASLQSQLGAIAKEYALPSTTGLILYLVTSAQSRNIQQSPTISLGDELDEPGPRLSEDIWKHLWTRVMKAEQRDDSLLSVSRSPTPNMFGLGIGARSTPFLPHESNGQPLRPFISTPTVDIFQLQSIPSPVTPSSTPPSSSDMQSNTKSAPPSSSSVCQSEPETPDTSSGSHSFLHDSAARANSLELPGLNSPSIIPILAKVEFDIDRRKAPWYDPWLRSRRMNYAKRAESRTSRRTGAGDDADGSESPQERQPPINFLTGRKPVAGELSPSLFPARDKGETIGHEPEKAPILEPTKPEAELEQGAEEADYEPLPESYEGTAWSDNSDSGEEFADEFTARVTTLTKGGDPLGDVFGTDADTWADIHEYSHRESKRQTNSNVVELALTGADLTAEPSPTDLEFENLGKEEDEVQALLDQMSNPRISVSTQSSPSAKEKRASTTTQASLRKHVPPPLVLHTALSPGDLAVPPEISPLPSSAGSTNLPYLNETSSEDLSHSREPVEYEDDEPDDEYTRVRSPTESDKRGGAVFDDLDLGLDPTEDFDDSDPHDRRRSQYLMKAQLDEIERTMAQLSPRILQPDLVQEQHSRTSATLSANTSVSLSPGMLNGDLFPPSPRLPRHPDYDSGNRDSAERKGQQAWPAVPFSSLNDPVISPPAIRPNAPPSPPRLAVNGVTTAAPKSYMPSPRLSATEISAETESRKRELEEEQASYPALTPSIGRSPAAPSDSPIIPLSPDPFGRFSSASTVPDGSRQSSTYWDSDPAVGSTALNSHVELETPPVESQKPSPSATSRFSADSMTGEDLMSRSNSRATLISVNTLKRLWRKSTKNPSSASVPPTPTSSGSRSSAQFPPSRSERPSQEQREPQPKTPTFGRFSSQPVPPRPSHEQPPIPQSQQLSVPQHASFAGRSPNPSPIVAKQMRPGRGGSSLDNFHFDQESPYPTRRAPHSPQPAPSPNLPSSSPSLSNQSLPSVPPPLDKDKAGMRKSILKGWKSASTSMAQPPMPPPMPEPRSSLERPNSGGPARSRRPSVLNFGSTRGSVSSPDIPPSPQIPQQFVHPRNNAAPHDHRQSIRSRLTSSSIDSSHSQQALRIANARSSSDQRSMTSSRDSEETRPSFDVSQFEIVSPKMNSTLSYPYHGLDHD